MLKPIPLTCWTLVAAIGIGIGSAQPPAPNVTPPASEATPPASQETPPTAGASTDSCADREAIAASIARLEAAKTSGAPFEQLVAQGTIIEKRILELRPDTERTCATDLSLLRLTERFDPLRREIANERRRQQIGAKPWPEP